MICDKYMVRNKFYKRFVCSLIYSKTTLPSALSPRYYFLAGTLQGFPAPSAAAASSHASPSAHLVGYPLLKYRPGSLLHCTGEISAVAGHLPGAQSFRAPPWYQGLGAPEAGAKSRQAESRRAAKRVVILHNLESSLTRSTIV